MDAVADRLCHHCLYSLQGHEPPARCPECGEMELPAVALAEARQAVVGGFLPRLIFRRKETLATVWQAVRLPAFRRPATRRLAIVVAGSFVLASVAVIACRFGTHSRPAAGTIEQRTWWYTVQYAGAFPLSGPTRNMGPGFLGWFYITRGMPVSTVREVARRGVLEAPLFLKDCLKGIRHTILMAGMVTIVAWCVLLGTHGSVGLYRLCVVLALLANSVYPALITAAMLVVAKLGYVFCLWGEWPVYVLSAANIVACVGIPLSWIWMTWACPAARWRVVSCVLVMSVSWLYLVLASLDRFPDALWNWI